MSSSFGGHTEHPPSSRDPPLLRANSQRRSPEITAVPQTSYTAKRPTTATSTSTNSAGEIRPANRSNILDHTHAVNNSVNLIPAMSSAASASPAVPGQQTRFPTMDNPTTNNPGSGSRLSVRRALGQRAESESIAALRRGLNGRAGRKQRTLSSHFDDDDVDAVGGREGVRWETAESMDGRGAGTSRAPFATVKRIFRSRSKSQSVPSGTASGISAQTARDLVPAIPPTVAPSATSPALVSTQPSVKRQSKEYGRAGSFFLNFGRARSPPTRAKSTSSHILPREADSSSIHSAAAAAKRQPAKSFTSSILAAPRPATNYSAEGGRDDDGVGIESEGSGREGAPSKRERKFSGLPASSSDGHALAFGFNRSRTDRALTLQSLSGTASPSYGIRRSSLTNSNSRSPNYLTLDLPTSSLGGHSPRTDGTPTPTTAQFPINQRATVPASDSVTPDASVPKMWQLACQSRSSTIDESPVRESAQGRHQQHESSTTSGSAMSFRTAQSYRDESTPDLPRLAIDHAGAQWRPGMLDTITSIPRSTASPLTDLIENLEQRMSSSSTGASTPTRDSAAARRAIATTSNVSSTPVSVQFPARTVAHTAAEPDVDRYEDQSSFSLASVTSSSRTPSPTSARRNTFGNELMQAAGAGNGASGAYWDRGAHSAGGAGANVSMHEIETSLAAVEAALQDHRMAGSMDPNPLRQYIAPRGGMNASTASIAGAAHLEGDDDDTSMQVEEQEPPLARVTLPPEQQFAIANAVKQVRRAISSSQLPQIPNEDDSDLSRSPMTESAPPFLASTAAGADVDVPKTDTLGLPPPQHRKNSAASQESTPLRAARVRQESMQDVEQAYARMVELVSTAAGIDLTPSPMPTTRAYTRRPTLSQPSAMQDTLDSPLQRVQAQSTAATAGSTSFILTPSAMQGWTSVSPYAPSQPLPPVAAAPPIASSRSARQQLLRESDALARVIGPLPDLSEETLEQHQYQQQQDGVRGRSSNVSLGSRRAMSSSPQPRFYRDGGAAYERGASPSGGDSGGIHTASGTSPSIVAKTQGSMYAVNADGSRAAAYGVGAPMASVFYPASHNRSASAQNVYEWQQNKPRFSSPGSSRMVQGAAAAAAAHKRISTGSSEVPRSSSEVHRQIADELAQRRIRAAAHHLSGSSAGVATDAARVSPEQATSVFGSAGAGSAAQHATDSGGTGSYRRSGSVRDWGRIEDLAAMQGMHGGGGSVRPSSNLSGGGVLKNSQMVRPSDGSDASDPARLAFIAAQRMASPTSSSVVVMQQRHALERDSLLDMLDRTRSEAHELSTRNEQMRADLHLEVTRVLELERECERRKQNEQQLARRVQALEEELKVEQADRVRIGELLERVQRAVDEAANARSGGGGGGVGGGGELQRGEGELFGAGLQSRILDVDEGEEQNHGGLGIATSSPTSSSVSIRQEDLLPIKTRIFDVSGTVDDQELLHGITSLHQHPEHSIFDLYGGTSRESSTPAPPPQPNSQQEQYGNSSPSLDSHASHLGLHFDGQDGQQDWALDQEVLPEVAMPSGGGMTVPRTPESRRSSRQDHPHTPPPPLRHVKRSPVLTQTPPGASSLTGSTSISSLTKKRRFPSLTLAGRAERAAVRRSSNEGGALSDGPPTPSLSPRSARQVSQSSRTTAGADTSSYTSPALSNIPGFPASFTGGIARKITPVNGSATRIPTASSKRASVDAKAYAAVQSRIPQMISAATAAKPTLQSDPITSSAAMRNSGSGGANGDGLYFDDGAATMLRIRSNEQQ